MHVKRSCPHCGGHFYEVDKAMSQCPYCQKSYDPMWIYKSKKRTVSKAVEVDHDESKIPDPIEEDEVQDDDEL